MTVNRASAISVLWVQLKAVCSTSWCCLVLIRERNQKLIILTHTCHTLTIDQLKHRNWLPCANSAGMQKRNLISIILTFSLVIYYFFGQNFIFGVFLSILTAFFRKLCAGASQIRMTVIFFTVKSLIDTEYFFINFRPSTA